MRHSSESIERQSLYFAFQNEIQIQWSIEGKKKIYNDQKRKKIRYFISEQYIVSFLAVIIDNSAHIELCGKKEFVRAFVSDYLTRSRQSDSSTLALIILILSKKRQK